MKVTIFGASGKTGQLLVRRALDKGHLVKAYVRRQDALNILHPGLEIITGTLDDQDRLQESISGADACISALGGHSLLQHSGEIIAGIDRIVTLMEKEGAGRMIYLSSIGAGESRFFVPQPVRFFISDLMLRVPLADHGINENRIARSILKWTIVRPGSLTDGPETGNIIHGHDKMTLKGMARISRADVASFMLDQLEETTYINKAVWLHG